MDVDLDFCDDKIESFLRTKLKEVHLQNASLQEVLIKRKEIRNSPYPEESNLEVNHDIWKKIYNNKYFLCYEIHNYSDDVIQDIKVLLWRNSKESFSYKIELFSEVEEYMCQSPESCVAITNNVRKAFSFRSKAFLAVVFDIPGFLQTINLTISGSVLYKIGSQDFQLQLPDLEISPSDFTSMNLQIATCEIKHIFTLQSCSNEDGLVLIFPEDWDASINNTFEIHFSFMKLVLPSCSEYFVSYNISKLFDYSLVKVHQIDKNKYFVKTYTNTNSQLLALLHHFNCSIPNIVILPQMYYSRYLCKNTVFSNELLQQFNESLGKELETSYKCVQQSGVNSSEDMLLLKKNLYETEKQSDQLFLKLSNVKY